MQQCQILTRCPQSVEPVLRSARWKTRVLAVQVVTVANWCSPQSVEPVLRTARWKTRVQIGYVEIGTCKVALSV